MAVFVGREHELRALQALADATSDGPAAALVVGVSGSGKSRLLAEARAAVGLPHSFEVLGYEPERHVPLAAAASLLRALTEVPEHGERLDALLLSTSDDLTLEPIRLFEAAHRAFGQLTRVLMVIDDLHWMDDLSFALCHYLIRGAHDAACSLVLFAATRPEERGASLFDALPEERVTRLELDPLSRDEGIELAQAIDSSLERVRAEGLWQEARGSPFWLEALARAGGGEGGSAELLTLRMRGANTDASSALALLAVAGRPIATRDAAELLGWPESRAAAAVDELARRGLVTQDVGSARLAHDLIRQAALPELSEEARMRLHQSLAEKLERAAGDDPKLLSEALEHRRLAQLPVFDLALRLARSPRRTLLGTGGCRLLGAIADDADPRADETLVLQENIAALAGELGEHEEALSRWTSAAVRIPNPQHRAEMLLAASRSAFALSRADEAQALLARSRTIEAGEVLALEQDIQEAAILLWLERETDAGRALARKAVQTAATIAAALGGVAHLDDEARQAYTDASRIEFEAAIQEGDVDALLDAARRWEDAARDSSSLETYLAGSLAVGRAFRQRGQLDEAAFAASGPIRIDMYCHVFSSTPALRSSGHSS